MSATKLKKAVKEAVSDDDRSRSVVVFSKVDDIEAASDEEWNKEDDSNQNVPPIEGVVNELVENLQE